MEVFVKLDGCYFVIPWKFDSISSNSTVWFNSHFCFIAFYEKYNTHLPNNKIPSENFLTWLVGFTEFRLGGVNNCKDVFSYFDKYTLYTKKSLSYKLWKDIHNDLFNKDHLDESTRQEMIERTKMINK